MTRKLALLLTVFVVVTALAELFGAANLGTAATFGEVAFIAALTGVLLRA